MGWLPVPEVAPENVPPPGPTYVYPPTYEPGVAPENVPAPTTYVYAPMPVAAEPTTYYPYATPAVGPESGEAPAPYDYVPQEYPAYVPGGEAPSVAPDVAPEYAPGGGDAPAESAPSEGIITAPPVYVPTPVTGPASEEAAAPLG